MQQKKNISNMSASKFKANTLLILCTQSVLFVTLDENNFEKMTLPFKLFSFRIFPHSLKIQACILRA